MICYNVCHGMSFRWQWTFRLRSNPRHKGIKWTSFGVCYWCFALACVVLGRHQLPANTREVEVDRRGLQERWVCADFAT